MNNKKLKEILTIMCIALWTASMGYAITTGILTGITLAIIYYTPWDD